MYTGIWKLRFGVKHIHTALLREDGDVSLCHGSDSPKACGSRVKAYTALSQHAFVILWHQESASSLDMRIYKVAFVGSHSVGKTSIALGFTLAQYRPTILALRRKSLALDSGPAAMDILDTSGSEEYVSLRDEAIRESDGFVVVYSIVNGETFKHISEIKNVFKTLKQMIMLPIVLVGNKLDLNLKRQVPRFEGERLAKEWCCPFFETYVGADNLHTVFETIAKEMNKSTAISWQQTEQSSTEISPASRTGCLCVII